MFRALSPVGHPLCWSQIPAILKKTPGSPGFLSHYFPPGSVFPVSSGTAALTISLLILRKVSDRKEVVLPAYSCPSLVAAVVKAGLKPVLCDLQPAKLVFDLGRLAATAGPDTLAVIAVHLFGVPENMPEIKALAEQKGFFLLEDAAQAFGNHSRALGGNFGALGDLGVISFGRGKPLSLLSGGAVILNNPALRDSADETYAGLRPPPRASFVAGYAALLMLYSLFFHPRTHWLPRSIPFLKLGETYYIDEFTIGRIGDGVLRFGERVHQGYPEIRETRKRLAGSYVDILKPYLGGLSFTPDTEGKDDIALLRFPVVFREAEKRDLVLAALIKEGLGATGSFPVPLNELKGAAPHIGGHPSGFPNAKAVSQRILTLPLHRYVRRVDLAAMSRIFSNILK